MKSSRKILITTLFMGLTAVRVQAMNHAVFKPAAEQKEETVQIMYIKSHGVDCMLIKAFADSRSSQIGYIQYVLGDENDAPSIYVLEVDVAFRGKGVASELLKQAFADIAEKSEKQQIQVDVYAQPYKDQPMTLEQLVAFYQKRGGIFMCEDSDTGGIYMKFVLQKSKVIF
jgi:ribosomal protein S18 acetylase RimI-like enzyme